MALAALIAAYHESGEPGVLRATLPLAGRTVIERQARLAAMAGASIIVILVERMPAALSAALDRLRRERLPVHIARTPEEAAEVIDPSARLLLVADGAVADHGQMVRLADGDLPAVLTVPDGSFGELYERIDASSRWAGLAAVDGALLRETASMLRDWDMQSTMLRRALQAGAHHLVADGPVAILDSEDDLVELERRIIASVAETRGGWAERLLAPVERALTAMLTPSPATPTMIGSSAALLAFLGAGAFLYQWPWVGLALILLATPLEGTALRLARLRMQEEALRSWWHQLMPALAGAALAALAYALAPAHGWGMILLAITTLAFMFALEIEQEGRTLTGAFWLAERRGMAWLMLPFAPFGQWHAGLAFLFAYAAGSFFWAQRQVHGAQRG